MKLLKWLLTIMLICAAVFLIVAFTKYSKGNNKRPTSTESGENTSTPDVTEKPENTENPDETEKPSDTAEPEATATATAEPEATATPEEKKLLSGVTVYINAGHQGSAMTDKESVAPWSAEENSQYNIDTLKTKCTSGTQGRISGVAEYVVTLQIALKLQALCEAEGATVVMSRTDNDVTKSNIDRANEANECNADIALHIHCNGADSYSANGIDVYTRGAGDGSDEYKKRSSDDYALGEALLNELVEATGARKRYTTKSDAYATINWAQMPSLIIECGFMSNEEEDLKLTSDDYQQLLAQGMFNFLVKEFGNN